MCTLIYSAGFDRSRPDSNRYNRTLVENLLEQRCVTDAAVFDDLPREIGAFRGQRAGFSINARTTVILGGNHNEKAAIDTVIRQFFTPQRAFTPFSIRF